MGEKDVNGERGIRRAEKVGKREGGLNLDICLGALESPYASGWFIRFCRALGCDTRRDHATLFVAIDHVYAMRTIRPKRTLQLCLVQKPLHVFSPIEFQ